MDVTHSSGLSAVYVNGELVDNKGFLTESDGENMNYILNNNDEIISGEIKESKLSEEDLIKLLEISKSKKSLMDQLKDDYPLTNSKKTRKKSKKKQKKRKTKRK
tara:strand:- start:32 stop:343 length:312 start_codon:yes stop_codon:yes gene_type:complete